MIGTPVWFIEQPNGLWRVGPNETPTPGSGEVGHLRTFYGPESVSQYPLQPVSEIDSKRWMHALCQRGFIFSLDGKVTCRVPRPGKIIVG